jgi:hypothetical protein
LLMTVGKLKSGRGRKKQQIVPWSSCCEQSSEELVSDFSIRQLVFHKSMHPWKKSNIRDKWHNSPYPFWYETCLYLNKHPPLLFLYSCLENHEHRCCSHSIISFSVWKSMWVWTITRKIIFLGSNLL